MHFKQHIHVGLIMHIKVNSLYIYIYTIPCIHVGINEHGDCCIGLEPYSLLVFLAMHQLCFVGRYGCHQLLRFKIPPKFPYVPLCNYLLFSIDLLETLILF